MRANSRLARARCPRLGPRRHQARCGRGLDLNKELSPLSADFKRFQILLSRSAEAASLQVKAGAVAGAIESFFTQLVDMTAQVGTTSRESIDLLTFNLEDRFFMKMDPLSERV